MSACIRLLIATRCELRGRCWWRHDHHVFVAGVVWLSWSPICLSLSAVANDSWDPLNVSILHWHVIVNKAVFILEHDNLWTVCIYRLECYCFEINVTWFCTIWNWFFFLCLACDRELNIVWSSLYYPRSGLGCVTCEGLHYKHSW